MKRKPNKVGKAFSEFFKSLWEDIADGFKKHWLGMIGRAVMFIVPLVYLIATYIYKQPSKWALPSFVWAPLCVFLLVYWGKLRGYLAIKVNGMQVENNIQRGKHAGAIIIIKTIQIASTIAPFVIFYRIFATLEAEALSAKNIFLFITICEAAGGILVLLDTIANVIDYSED